MMVLKYYSDLCDSVLQALEQLLRIYNLNRQY